MKPCPFCSSEELDVGNWDGWEVAVRCAKCGAMGPERNNDEDARAAWNIRPREKQAFIEGEGLI